YYQEQDQEQALHKELDQRASLAAFSLADGLQPMLDRNASTAELRRVLNRLSSRERIVGAAILDDAGKSVAVTERLPAVLEEAFPILAPKVDPQNPDGVGVFLRLGTRYYHAQTLSLHEGNGKALGLLVVLITFLVIRWSLMGPITKAAQWLKALRSGKPGELLAPKSELLGPLAK